MSSNKPYCLSKIQAAIAQAGDKIFVTAELYPSSKDLQTIEALDLVSAVINDPRNTAVLALLRAKDLERYSILPGKIFATDMKAKEKYKILRLVANDVIYKNLSTGDVKTEEINSLLKRWNQQQVKEVSLITEVLKVVKQVLGPLLGVFLTSVLTNWLLKKL